MVVIETTYNEFVSTVNGLPQNDVDNPYDIKVTDNLVSATMIGNVNRYIRLSWGENVLAESSSAKDFFRNCHFLVSVDMKPFSNCTNFLSTFYNCENLKNIDLSVIDNIIIMKETFMNCSSLIEVIVGNLRSVNSAESAFYGCESLLHFDATTLQNMEYASSMFRDCSSLSEILTPTEGVVKEAEFMFFNCSSLVSVDTAFLSNITSAKRLFSGCASLENIDTTNFTRIREAEGMFSNCSKLKHIDTNCFSTCKEFSYLFYGCSSLESIYTEPFKQWQFRDSTQMFYGCSSLREIDITPLRYTYGQSTFRNSGITKIIITSVEDNLTGIQKEVLSSLGAQLVDIEFTDDVPLYFPIECQQYIIDGLKDRNIICTVLDGVKPTTIAKYQENVSSLQENTADTFYEIQITDIENLNNENLKTAIIDTGRYVKIYFKENDVYAGSDGNNMFRDCNCMISIDAIPFSNIENASSMFEGCNLLANIDTQSFSKVKNATAMFKGTGLPELKFDDFNDIITAIDMFNTIPVEIVDIHKWSNLEYVNFPVGVKTIDVHGTKLKEIDLTGLLELEYLNVSETDIASLNLLECTSLPYCKFEIIEGVKVLKKGWLAQNCKMLTTIKALQEQVQDAGLNLDNDTNACLGCDSLQEVEVSCKSAPSFAGNEVHYGKVDFKNDVTYKGVPLDEIGASTKKILNVLANTLFDVGSFIASKNPNFDPNRIFVGTTWKLLPAGKLLEQSDSNDNLGQEVDPALPNIKGDVYFNNGSNNVIGTGAMKKSTLRTVITGWIGVVTGNQLTVPHIKVDASDSSSIYKDDCNTVQPSTIKTNIWERIA